VADRLRRLPDGTGRAHVGLLVGGLGLRERAAGEPGHRRRRPRGGGRIRQHARVLSAGFESDIVHDLREYPATIPLDRYYGAIGATEVESGAQDTIAGHTVIDSIEAITRLSSEEFYRLYGQSTNRALVFTSVTRGESPLVAMRVVTPTPNAVVLHGIDEDDLWEHAPTLARIDGFSLAVTTLGLPALLEGLDDLP
jgi:putative transcriptional regulator